jgi:hypothetical protein
MVVIESNGFNRKAVAVPSPGLPVRLPWGVKSVLISTATRLRRLGPNIDATALRLMADSNAFYPT